MSRTEPAGTPLADAFHVYDTTLRDGAQPEGIGKLVTKLGMPVLPDGLFSELTRTSHALAEIANLAPDAHQAYVGTSAFAHKAGLHASAIKVDPEPYNHVNPVVVGNGQRVLVTEMAGRAGVGLKGTELGLDPAGHPTRVLPESTDHSQGSPAGPRDGAASWTTLGVHGHVVEASWLALVDARAYAAARRP